MRGKRFASELELMELLELELRERGLEEGKRRRRRRMSSEIKDESKAANFRDSMYLFVFFGGIFIFCREFDFLGNRGQLLCEWGVNLCV